MTKKISKNPYESLLNDIQKLISEARESVARSINVELLYTYWATGKLIVEKEVEFEYDEQSVRDMLVDLSQILTYELGKGFSRSQLTYMRLFYLTFSQFGELPARLKTGLTVSNQKSKLKKETYKIELKGTPNKYYNKSKNRDLNTGLTVSNQLSWSHYHELLQCNHSNEIEFYMKSAIHENWSVRELRRQIDSSLFERMVLGNKRSPKKIVSKGTVIKNSEDIIRDPYILEFLKIPEGKVYSERQFEQKIIDNLQNFILEFGKGFTFVSRQFRITLDNTHYYVDLVFYHRILRCFVLIDLKVRSVRHQDIGQMNMYLNYFEAEQNTKDDQAPIGIILGKQKDNITVDYAMKGISSKIFVSKYQLYLPDKEILQKRVKDLVWDLTKPKQSPIKKPIALKSKRAGLPAPVKKK
ncbi:MAG: PDDEXK nuclease domain-containing protein [Bacteroidia bacterium]